MKREVHSVRLDRHDALLIAAVLNHFIAELASELTDRQRPPCRTAMHWTKAEAIELRNRLDFMLIPKKPEPKKGAA